MTLATIISGLALGVFQSQESSARERARFAIQRAQELNPDFPLVLEYLGLMATTGADGLRRMHTTMRRGGRISDAIRHLEQARNVNRLDRDVALMLALAYGCAGDFELALAEFDRAAALEPSPRASALQGAFTLIALGSRDPALISRVLGDIPDSSEGVDPLKINRWAQSYLDDPDGAREMLHRQAPALMESSPLPLAGWANYYGDPELGLQAYRSTPSELQIVLGIHLWVPLYQDMRRLPAFKSLVQYLGLVDYWRESGRWSDFCSAVGELDFVCS